MSLSTPLANGIHRRGFLRLASYSFLGLSASQLLAATSTETGRRSPARNIILVWLGGGPATIDMWDMKPENAGVRGEFKPIDTSAPEVQICEHLPKMAQQMHEVTLVRSVTHTIAEHQQGTQYVVTGNPISPAVTYPSIGAVVSNQLGKEDPASLVPAYVDLSGLDIGKAGYLGSPFNPFVANRFSVQRRRRPPADHLGLPPGLSVGDLDRRSSLLGKIESGFRFNDDPRAEEMLAFQKRATGMLSSGHTRDALNLSLESQQVREQYGFGLGQSALAARRLIEAGTRFVTIGMRGWDTHSNNFTQLRQQLLPQLDTALSTLLNDLKSRGLLEETIVYCVGEFNRTPTINSAGGRDHWARSMSVLIAGGGFRRGFVHGATDPMGQEPTRDACSPADINATILNQVGIAPDTMLTTKVGRPLKVFRDGEVLSELV